MIKVKAISTAERIAHQLAVNFTKKTAAAIVRRAERIRETKIPLIISESQSFTVILKSQISFLQQTRGKEKKEVPELKKEFQRLS